MLIDNSSFDACCHPKLIYCSSDIYSYFNREFANIWPTFRSHDIINEEDFKQKKVKNLSRKSL